MHPAGAGEYEKKTKKTQHYFDITPTLLSIYQTRDSGNLH